VRWADILDLLFPSACVECDAGGTALCAACFPPAPPLAFEVDDLGCTALGEYEGAWRRAVLALKSGRRDVAGALGALLGPLAGQARVDAIVPVPTTAARRRRRGFDQGELLARVAAKLSGRRLAVILRQTAGDAQRGRSRDARIAAVGRFALIGASLPAGSRVLLVDDVATTGATLRDCTKTLRAAGLLVNGGLVVARARDERAHI
jgi:predicted amidophosphoribosyltransferase